MPTDRVALEVTGGGGEIGRILEPPVQQVVVVSPDDTGITSARTQTDTLDSRTLAALGWKSELEAVGMPDERCGADCSPSHRARTGSGSQVPNGWPT